MIPGLKILPPFSLIVPLSVSLFVITHLLENLLDGKNMLPAQRFVPISGIYKIWVEAGCAVSGVLFQIKKNVKSRYKYEVHRLKCRQDIILQKKLAQLFSGKDKTRFWSEIHRLNHSHPCSSPCVDGVSGGKNISNACASKFQNVLNANPGF